MIKLIKTINMVYILLLISKITHLLNFYQPKQEVFPSHDELGKSMKQKTVFSRHFTILSVVQYANAPRTLLLTTQRILNVMLQVMGIPESTLAVGSLLRFNRQPAEARRFANLIRQKINKNHTTFGHGMVFTHNFPEQVMTI